MTLTDWNPSNQKEQIRMNDQQYLENCLKTEAVLKADAPVDVELLIHMFSVSDKLGKLVNQTKKKMFYGANISHSDLRPFLRELSQQVTKLDDELCLLEGGLSDSDTCTDVDLAVLHGMIGAVTEIGELSEVGTTILRENHISEASRVNIVEELGDMCWYFAPIIRVLKIDYPFIWIRNIAKLAKRYKDQVFTAFQAEDANRDLKAEYAELEKQ